MTPYLCLYLFFQVKNRSRRLTDLFQSYRPYDHKLGEKQEVLVTEQAHDQAHWVAHNKFYEQVGWWGLSWGQEDCDKKIMQCAR